LPFRSRSSVKRRLWFRTDATRSTTIPAIGLSGVPPTRVQYSQPIFGDRPKLNRVYLQIFRLRLGCRCHNHAASTLEYDLENTPRRSRKLQPGFSFSHTDRSVTRIGDVGAGIDCW
jgi:hypothetical protein